MHTLPYTVRYVVGLGKVLRLEWNLLQLSPLL